MPLTTGIQNPSSTDKGRNPVPGIRPTMPAFVKGLINMIIRLCKAWRVIRRSFFPFVREARRSFPIKRMPDRSCQYVKYFAKRASCRYGTGRCDVSLSLAAKICQAFIASEPTNHIARSIRHKSTLTTIVIEMGGKRSPSVPLREIFEF